MCTRSGCDREQGSAVVEFAVLGIVLLGVLVEVIVMFGTLQRATLATSAAAREVGRAVVFADSLDDAASRSAIVMDQAAANHGVAPESLDASVDGELVRGSRLRVTVATEVPLVRIPFIGPVWPSLSVPVESTHVVQVDRYRSFP
jgi:Flp pilus assembly protein TadG